MKHLLYFLIGILLPPFCATQCMQRYEFKLFLPEYKMDTKAVFNGDEFYIWGRVPQVPHGAESIAAIDCHDAATQPYAGYRVFDEALFKKLYPESSYEKEGRLAEWHRLNKARHALFVALQEKMHLDKQQSK